LLPKPHIMDVCYASRLQTKAFSPQSEAKCFS
jgi:hypothetical protein